MTTMADRPDARPLQGAALRSHKAAQTRKTIMIEECEFFVNWTSCDLRDAAKALGIKTDSLADNLRRYGRADLYSILRQRIPLLNESTWNQRSPNTVKSH